MGEIATNTSFWDFKGEDEYRDQKFLMATPFPVALLLISYLSFVLKIGPEYMKNRKPFNLSYWLLFYNALQVIISLRLFLTGMQALWKYGLWHSTCYCEKEEFAKQFTDGTHFYFLMKIIELTDTVCFVLRKRQRQVSFLHVYHHTIMVLTTWSIAKYSKTDNAVFLAVINCLVHVIMYAYYGLSVFPKLTKYLWWKKYITMMQLVQFILMFLYVVVSHFISECRPAYFLISSVCFNTVLFMYLFGKFYIKSYIKMYTARDIVKAGKKIGSNIGANNGINSIINDHKLGSKIH